MRNGRSNIHTSGSFLAFMQLAVVLLIIMTGLNQVNATTGTSLAKNQLDTFREYILKPGESRAKKISDNLFVKANAEKNTCYVGEPIVVTYKLYSRLTATSKITKQPNLGGFSVYDMIDLVSNTASTEFILNRPFKVHLLRKAQLIPLQAGTMQLDAMEIQNNVHFVRSSSTSTLNGDRLHDLMDQFSKEESMPSADLEVKIQSRPVNIEVKSFPEDNRPTNFNGAVGRFTIKATIITKNLSAYDAGLLKIEIKGMGNISMIAAPAVRWPPGIDEVDIRSSEQINKTVIPLNGLKTFEYVFTPTSAGKYIIPPISFSYFDASSHSYQTILTQQHAFLVAAGNKPLTGKAIADSSLSRVKNTSSLNIALEYLEHQFAWIVIVGILLILVFYLVRKNNRLQKKQETGITAVTSSLNTPGEAEAPGQPADVFDEASKLLEKEDYKTFYQEVNNLLWNEIALILKLPLSELNKQNIFYALKQKGWTNEMADRLDGVLIKCERSIYLPDYQQETDAATVFETAKKVMADLITNDSPR